MVELNNRKSQIYKVKTKYHTENRKVDMVEINNRESQIFKVKAKCHTENFQNTVADPDDQYLLLDDDFRIEESFGVTDFSHIYSIPNEVKQILGW